jgi:hypothetical protein
MNEEKSSFSRKSGYEKRSLLSIAFARDDYDFINSVKDLVKLDDYDCLLNRATFNKRMDLVYKIITWLKSIITDFDEFRYQSLILMGLQKQKHYGIGPLGSLEDIIQGSKERIGNININLTENEYCQRIRGIICYHGQDKQVWESLRKNHWNAEMYNTFYFAACQAQNHYVVKQIENTGVEIKWHYNVLKCVMFGLYDDLQKLINSVNRERLEKRRVFVEYLWQSIVNFKKGDIKLVDLFIDNFGFECIVNQFMAFFIEDEMDASTRLIVSHLIKRGLLISFPDVVENFLSEFVKFIDKFNENILLILQHTRDDQNLHTLRSSSSKENLLSIFIRSKKQHLGKLLTSDEIKDLEKLHLEISSTLSYHLLPELASIIVSHL